MTQPGPSSNRPSSNKPTPREVNEFHDNSDRDSAKIAQHHTLGPGANQASPGDHKHNGRDSKLILAGLDASFPTTADGSYSQSQMQAVIDILREIGAGE